MAIVNIRSGPNWASIGSAQEALVGVRHNSTLCAAAHVLIAGVVLQDRLSSFCGRARYVAGGDRWLMLTAFMAVAGHITIRVLTASGVGLRRTSRPDEGAVPPKHRAARCFAAPRSSPSC